MPVTILMYHMIAEPGNSAEARFCRTPEAFRADMEQIRLSGLQVLPLTTVLEAVAGGVSIPERAVAITFDDGVACAYENALPILQEYGCPATVFVISGLLGGHNDWCEEFGFPRRRMLVNSEVRALVEAGVDIGSHTVSHPWLGKSDANVVKQEVRDSKAALENLLGREVPHFAYPFGSWSPVARDAVVEAGYTGACSTMSGVNKKGTDSFLLRRTEIKGSDAAWQFRLKLRFATNDMPPVSDARRLARHALEGMGLIRPRASGY
jgi:peptidoglycan/xylan/chitin deacetylase (PgdA/CDA1 family)